MGQDSILLGYTLHIWPPYVWRPYTGDILAITVLTSTCDIRLKIFTIDCMGKGCGNRTHVTTVYSSFFERLVNPFAIWQMGFEELPEIEPYCTACFSTIRVILCYYYYYYLLLLIDKMRSFCTFIVLHNKVQSWSNFLIPFATWQMYRQDS